MMGVYVDGKMPLRSEIIIPTQAAQRTGQPLLAGLYADHR
jgi:hypothetical protein